MKILKKELFYLHFLSLASNKLVLKLLKNSKLEKLRNYFCYKNKKLTLRLGFISIVVSYKLTLIVIVF